MAVLHLADCHCPAAAAAVAGGEPDGGGLPGARPRRCVRPGGGRGCAASGPSGGCGPAAGGRKRPLLGNWRGAPAESLGHMAGRGGAPAAAEDHGLSELRQVYTGGMHGGVGCRPAGLPGGALRGDGRPPPHRAVRKPAGVLPHAAGLFPALYRPAGRRPAG